MRIRLHPVLLPLFLMLAILDGLAAYAIVFLSLLLHEAGHATAAYLSGMKIRSITIYPYGGELEVASIEMHTKSAKVFLALGGPFATFLVFLAALGIPFPSADYVIHVQLIILCINLLPILPLDGGQVLLALFETEESRFFDYNAFIIFSITCLVGAIFLLAEGLPETVLLLSLGVFLFFKNLAAFRYRRYRRVYEQLKRNRLT